MSEPLSTTDGALNAGSILKEYNPNIYNDLQDPIVAYDYVTSLKGEETINTTIRDVFVRHEMCDTFGITLLHRHFDMVSSEKLVAVTNTSIPWGPDACEDQNIGKIVPQAFIFPAPGQVVPFEYTFFTNEVLGQAGKVIGIEAATKAFVEELSALLFSLKLEKVLGLRVFSELRGNHNVEFTVGRANIFVELENPIPNSIPTSWYFCALHPDSCRCQITCKHKCVSSCERSVANGGHMKHHQGDSGREHSGRHY